MTLDSQQIAVRKSIGTYDNGVQALGHSVNQKTYNGMPLHELLSQAAIFVENYIDDHHDSYEGPRDSLYLEDKRLARLLNQAARKHTPKPPRTRKDDPMRDAREREEFANNFKPQNGEFST